MADGVRRLVVDVLAGHVDELQRTDDGGLVSTCSCGQWSRPVTGSTLSDAIGEWKLHRADAVLAVLDGRLLPEGGP